MSPENSPDAAATEARIVFIRHGETDWNLQGRLQGQRDIPLNQKGRVQAEAAGQRLARIFSSDRLGNLRFVASPLSRATQTMELARASAGLSAEGYDTDPRLMELTFGSWEGLTWPEVKARAPEAAHWREGDKWNYVPPGGESYGMLAKRVVPWLEEQDDDVVVVSHGGVARVLMAVLAGVDEQRAALADIWQGRLIVFHKNRFQWI